MHAHLKQFSANLEVAKELDRIIAEQGLSDFVQTREWFEADIKFSCYQHWIPGDFGFNWTIMMPVPMGQPLDHDGPFCHVIFAIKTDKPVPIFSLTFFAGKNLWVYEGLLPETCAKKVTEQKTINDLRNLVNRYQVLVRIRQKEIPRSEGLEMFRHAACLVAASFIS